MWHCRLRKVITYPKGVSWLLFFPQLVIPLGVSLHEQMSVYILYVSSFRAMLFHRLHCFFLNGGSDLNTFIETQRIPSILELKCSNDTLDRAFSWAVCVSLKWSFLITALSFPIWGGPQSLHRKQEHNRQQQRNRELSYLPNSKDVQRMTVAQGVSGYGVCQTYGMCFRLLM